MSILSLFRRRSGQNDQNRKQRLFFDMRDAYNSIAGTNQNLSEAEKLAYALQAVFGEGEVCLRMAAPFSVLPSQEALQVLGLFITRHVHPDLFSTDDRDQFVTLVTKVINLVIQRCFLAEFISKNKAIESDSFWSEFRSSSVHWLETCNSATFVFSVDPFTLDNVARFDETTLSRMAVWKQPNCTTETPAEFGYELDGKHVDVLNIDIILESTHGLYLVKCPINTKAYILKRFNAGNAAIIGEHFFAVELLGYLKRQQLIPLTTDTWEWTFGTLEKKCWSSIGCSVATKAWTCAYCGRKNSPDRKSCLISAAYDDGLIWGECQLLECSDCSKVSVVLPYHMQRLPNGQNLMRFEDPVTIAGGPQKTVLKREILKTKSKNFLVPDDTLAKW